MTDSAARPVRTRFAPSPTGSLHIGGLRTALFNWLFARHHGGQFILRIEDTDQNRFDPTALTTLMEALRWAGLQWDEGPEINGPFAPYVQSERLAGYQQQAQWLVDEGKAYKCFCSSERLKQVNEAKTAKGEPSGYDRFCRHLTPVEVAEREAQGQKYVIRFKMPLEGQTVVQDAIRGETVFENNTQQDMVLLKSDGFPTYHLAHVLDDHAMQISHVMRAVEWFPSFPLHWQIWEAFGWEKPIFAHLPVLLNPNGKGKMSKRNPPKDKFGNIIPVMVHDYMRGGYLPEAMDNFLTNIGWNFGDEREFFSMAEAIERFDLTRINPANSAFPVEKLEWLNGEHIRALPMDELATRLRDVFETAGLTVRDEVLRQVAPLLQIRLKRLTDAVAIAGFFFRDEFTPPPPEHLIQKKMDAAQTQQALERSIAALAALTDFSHASQQAVLEPLTTELGLSNGQLFGVLRVAVTGQQVSTPLFETMEVLGQAESVARLELAQESLRDSIEKSVTNS